MKTHRTLAGVYVVGRKSGRRYAVPVARTRYEGDLLIGTPFGWGRNLRTGEAVTIRLEGRRRLADVRSLWKSATTPRLKTLWLLAPAPRYRNLDMCGYRAIVIIEIEFLCDARR